MAHFFRTHPDATWNNSGAGGYITLQSDWLDLANKVFYSINGDQGGVWAPSTQLSFNVGGFIVNGPTLVNFDGTLTTISGSRFNMGGADYPKLASNHAGQYRTIESSMASYICTPHYLFQSCPTIPGSIQSIACTVVMGAGPSTQTFDQTLQQAGCLIPLRVHDGARLTSGVLKFTVPTARSTIPVALPKMRIVRSDTSGNLVSLCAPSSTVDANGYFSLPKIYTGAAWYAGGLPQAWTFTCNQNNIIDTSQYTYFLQLIEETGTANPDFSTSNADGYVVRERKPNVIYTFVHTPFAKATGNASFYPLPNGNPNIAQFDGNLPAITIPDGSEVLINIPSNDASITGFGVGGTAGYRSQNGIWIVHWSGAWQRRGDLRSPSDITANWLVYDTYLNRFWECVFPTFGTGQGIALHDTFFNGIAPGIDATGGGVPSYVLTVQIGDARMGIYQRTPRGNIYHSIACNFDSIADMRPQ